jgi:hypothetical protein
MRSVVVLLRSSRAQRAFSPDTPVPQILGRIAEWLALAEASARESCVCKSFSVEVHLAGADCDHEREGGGHERA